METIENLNSKYAQYSFLSYLWGMETKSVAINQFPFIGSYPTYEEWKLPMLNSHKKSWKRSYPTYEEWKQEIKQAQGT